MRRPKRVKPEEQRVKPDEQEYPPYEILEGEIIELKATALFAVRLDDGRVLSCHIGRTRIPMPTVGTRVWVEISPYDADRGRIRKVIASQNHK